MLCQYYTTNIGSINVEKYCREVSYKTIVTHLHHQERKSHLPPKKIICCKLGVGGRWGGGRKLWGDVKSRQPQTKQIQMESLRPNGGEKESYSPPPKEAVFLVAIIVRWPDFRYDRSRGIDLYSSYPHLISILSVSREFRPLLLC